MENTTRTISFEQFKSVAEFLRKNIDLSVEEAGVMTVTIACMFDLMPEPLEALALALDMFDELS